MQQIQIDLSNPTAPKTCSKCGGSMRLVGSEPHPVAPETDLLTFSCTSCEDVEVVPVPVHGATAA